MDDLQDGRQGDNAQVNAEFRRGLYDSNRVIYRPTATYSVPSLMFSFAENFAQRSETPVAAATTFQTEATGFVHAVAVLVLVVEW